MIDLEARRKGIGGTDCPAILGISPWKTPLEVYLDKKGLLPPQEDTPSMENGRRREPELRQWYCDITSREVRVPGIIFSQQHPFMLANLDGITSDNRILEIKTSSTGKGWGEPGSDDIPGVYQCQAQHYMAVTGIEVTDVFVSIMGAPPVLYEVRADAELQKIIIRAEKEFWYNNVLAGVEPDCRCIEDVQRKFSKSTAGEVIATTDLLTLIEELKSHRERILFHKQEEDGIIAILMAAMGEKDTLVNEAGKPLVTWKSGNAPQRFNKDEFIKKHNKLYQRFLVTGKPTRRFLLK